MLKAINGRRLAIFLGILWLIDGFAQLQPKMFTAKLANKVVLPNAAGQPLVVRGPIHFFVHLFLLNPHLFNSLILITQVGLGILILHRRTVLWGLKLSIIWALFVWIIGEGYGGLFTFNSNMLMGLPGAATLYILLAIVAISQIQNKNRHEYSGYWFSFAWAAIWIIGGIFQLLPNQGSMSVFLSMTGGVSGEPGWMYSFSSHLTNHLSSITSVSHQSMNMTMGGGSGYWFILCLALLEILIGLCVFMPRKVFIFFIGLSIVLNLLFWVVGQELGGYFSGLATDPNTGPLLILSSVVLMGFSHRPDYVKRLFRRLESALV